MITGAVPAAHVAIDAGALQLSHQAVCEQQMVETQPRIPLPALSPIVPERVDRALGVDVAEGIDPALVTCDDDNVGSARVIEANGGVLEDVRAGKRRYWVATGG